MEPAVFQAALSPLHTLTLIPYNIHLTDGTAEAQGGCVMNMGSHSQYVVQLGFKLRPSDFRLRVPTGLLAPAMAGSCASPCSQEGLQVSRQPKSSQLTGECREGHCPGRPQPRPGLGRSGQVAVGALGARTTAEILLTVPTPRFLSPSPGA